MIQEVERQIQREEHQTGEQRIHGIVVAHLDMQRGEGQEGRCQQPHPAPVQPTPKKIDKRHRPNVGQR